MRFNFRKVSAVIASAVMLGSSVGIAAAANYPAPFLSGSTADVAIVYGQNANVIDSVQAGLISTDLQARYGTPSTTTPVTGNCAGGDCVLFKGASDNLNMNDALTDVKATEISASDMPTMLKKITYRSYDGNDFDYEQKVKMYPNINLTHFADNDYNDNIPTVGIKLAKGSSLLNYSIDFVKAAQSSVNADGRLADLENTDITILGKSYKILQAYNDTAKLVLMAGAATGTVDYNEEKKVSVDGKDYTVTLTYVDASKARLKVNGEDTGDIVNGGTWKLSDGTQIGVRSILYQNYAGGINRVEYSLGANKLTIENGQPLQVNDVDVDSVTGYITKGTSGSDQTISKIVLKWKPTDEVFVTENSSISMPGLETLKLSMADFVQPTSDKIQIENDGSDTIALKAPIKSGDANIDVLYGTSSTFTGIGKGASNKLITSNTTSLTYDTDTDEYFVTTWASTTAAESYLLKATLRQSSGINYTTIKDGVSGTTYCSDKKPNDVCTIGSAELTVSSINYATSALTLTSGSGVNFNYLYTVGGTKIQLPFYGNDNVSNAIGGINLTATPASYTFFITEKDKNGNLAGGSQLNVTVGWTSAKTTVLTTVPNTGAAAGWSAGQMLDTADSDIQEGYMHSDLASKVVLDSSGTQDTATIYAPSGESYGLVYLSATDTAITTSGGSTGIAGAKLGNVIVDDTEIDSVKSKNLIVVGGSCVNSAAATLLGGQYCGDEFTTQTGIGSGQFLIQSFKDKFTTGKIAVLVAGYDKADTVNAVTYLLNKQVDTTAGKKYKGTTATTAELVTETTA